MRYWCNGSISAFQAFGIGSNPLYRFKKVTVLSYKIIKNGVARS